MAIGLNEFFNDVYYTTKLYHHDESIRQSISESEATVRDLISTTPSLERALAEYEETNSFSRLIEDMEYNEQAVLERGE